MTAQTILKHAPMLMPGQLASDIRLLGHHIKYVLDTQELVEHRIRHNEKFAKSAEHRDVQIEVGKAINTITAYEASIPDDIIRAKDLYEPGQMGIILLGQADREWALLQKGAAA